MDPGDLQAGDTALRSDDRAPLASLRFADRHTTMLNDLNPPQRKAVTTLSGPLLVLAGAGTGKTRVVTYRIARLIKHGVPPEAILAVTFTNKAATEMQQRAGELLGRRRKQRPEISTFHSLCVRVLRRRITALGYPAKFAIYDRGDQESIARTALREIKVSGEMLRPRDLLFFIGNWKNKGIRPQQAVEVASSDKEHLAASGYRRYQKALQAAGAVDFDDLLLCTEELFENHPEIRREEAARFQHLLVDEYQDTNGSQYRIIRALALGHRNLCVVGDDDQSIYGWRGAEVAHILRFKRDWPEATVVRLEDNYRSMAPILEVANRLIAFNQERHDKVLRPARKGGEKPHVLQFADEEGEAKYVAEDIQKLVRTGGVQPRDIAILFRTNEQPRAFEQELRRRDVPYILVGGMSFFDRKEVRDIMSYLKLLLRPSDEVALLRIINVPQRGIGQTTVKRLMEQAVSQGQPLWDVVRKVDGSSNLPSAAVQGLTELRKTLDGIRQLIDKRKVDHIVREVISQFDYRREIERQYPNANDQEMRWNAVEEVVNAAAQHESRYEEPSLAKFMDDISTNDRDDDKETQLKQNAVALMTMHSAKGLEFPRVYMVGMEEGLLPHQRSISEDERQIDEERRLCYVGLTRAQDVLTLSLAQSRRKWGKSQTSIPSRFLFELLGKADNPAAARAMAAKAAAANAPKSNPTGPKSSRPRSPSTGRRRSSK